MILLEKFKILTPLQKLPKNVGDLGKLIVAKCFEKLSKVQLLAQSGHIDASEHNDQFFGLFGKRHWQIPNRVIRLKKFENVSRFHERDSDRNPTT